MRTKLHLPAVLAVALFLAALARRGHWLAVDAVSASGRERSISRLDAPFLTYSQGRCRAVPLRTSTIPLPSAPGFARHVRHAGLKQRELTFEGCTPAYLSRVEAGQRIPSLQILTRLAEQLGTTAEFLATGKHPEPDPLFEAELAARTGETELARRLYSEATTQRPAGRERARRSSSRPPRVRRRRP